MMGEPVGATTTAKYFNTCCTTDNSYNLTTGYDGGGHNVSVGGNHAHHVPEDMRMEPYGMGHLLVTAIVLGTIILATIIGNVFVIAAVILERNLHNVANYLIASLAVADLMVAALVMPLAAVNEVSKQWFLGTEVCDMFISFDVLCCTSSILHLVCISLDRYWAVTRVDYIHNRSARRILIMIALSWAISASISIPPLFGWKDDNSPEETGVCLISQDWGYTVFSTLGAFYLPLALMIIIYLKIFQAARSRIRKKHFRQQARRSGMLRSSPPLSHTTDTTALTTSTIVPPVPSTPIDNSPELSVTNGSCVPETELNDANRNSKQYLSVSPPGSPASDREPESTVGTNGKNQKGSWLDLTKMYLDGKKHQHHVSPKSKRTKEKIEAKRERKAARTLAIITGTFIFCWLPFFIIALVRPFCGDHCKYPDLLVSIIGWLGYFNSLLNPVIYTIFNPDFRTAFSKILFGKYRGQQNARRRHLYGPSRR